MTGQECTHPGCDKPDALDLAAMLGLDEVTA